MNKRELVALLKLIGAIILFIAVFGILGYLDRPEDYDDSEAWETQAYYEWLEKKNGNTNDVEKVKTDSTTVW